MIVLITSNAAEYITMHVVRLSSSSEAFASELLENLESFRIVESGSWTFVREK